MSTPTLDAIANGASVEGLSPREIAGLIATCGAVLARLVAVQARVAASLAQGDGAPAGIAPDRLLTKREAAAVWNVSETWLYRRPTLPFVVRVGSHVRCYERRLNRFITSQVGAER